MTTDSGQVFGERFRAGLLDLSKRIGRLVPVLDKQFSAVLQEQSVLPQQVQLLARITPGAVARTLRPDPEPLAFFGRVQEAGLELAQWNFPPEGLIASLRQYESLLNASPIELADLDWVREQLNFCTLLTLNDAYYRVRETETRKLQELFQIETDAKDEASLWQPYLESLVTYCGADAASFHVPSRDGDLRCVARVGKPEAKSTPSRRKSKTRLNSLNPHWSGRYESVWLVSLNDGPAGPRAQLEMAFRSERAFLPRERSMLENAGQRFLRS
ncbi:MAG TPA: hypothetical protein VE621_21955, partial [Bryobacteraceae bacterium]|nr:hypothetical protein [Bryobacteraceae bacterium]